MRAAVRLAADRCVLGVELVSVDTGGDDCVTVGGDARALAGIDRRIATGAGDDTFALLLEPPPGVDPVTDLVRRLTVTLSTGAGDDRVRVEHRAGGFFDVFFSADLGAGADLFAALILPPPAGSPAGPPGARTLRFDVAAGAGSDAVAVRNDTGRAYADVSFNADLGAGNDAWEASGFLHPSVAPGPGTDTARVIRNLLPFTDEYERVVLHDEDR